MVQMDLRSDGVLGTSIYISISLCVFELELESKFGSELKF